METLYIAPCKRKSTQDLNMSKQPSNNSKVKLIIDSLGLENFQGDIMSKSIKKDSLKGTERFTYTPTSDRGIVFIPVNRLKQVYQTDKATNPAKVKENMKRMKAGEKLQPIQVGYNYDVHDGHHRWKACFELGYSHVPCEIVGTDPALVRQAKKMYRSVWKSINVEEYTPIAQELESKLQKLSEFKFSDELLVISKSENLEELISDNIKEESKAIENYRKVLDLLEDEDLQDIILEIIQDEQDHYHNLQVVLNYIQTDRKEQLKDLGKSLSYIIPVDLVKGTLNTSRLVKKRVPVKGKDGKIFYRMQWTDPNKDSVDGEINANPDREESSYSHDESGLSDLEKRYSNKFPVRHLDVDKLENTIWNYKPDRELVEEAKAKFNRGEKLPPVHIDNTGEILDNHHLVDMAKELGLNNIPVIVFGNPKLKKEFEKELEDSVFMEEENEEGEKVLTDMKNVAHSWENQYTDSNANDHISEDVAQSIDDWKSYTSQVYPKNYLMKYAKEKYDLVWKEYDNEGNLLAENSKILWMSAYMAIENYIRDGNEFSVPHNQKLIDERMKQNRKDNMHSYYLRVLKSFNWDKDTMMEQCRKKGISWKENVDPSKNYMNFVMALKKELAKGTMVNGVRTKQKQAMAEANLMITDQIKSQVKAYGQKYGKAKVLDRARSLGIVFPETDSNGKTYASNSAILWMGASMSIQRYIAQGNVFTVTEEDNPDSNVSSIVDDFGGDSLTKMQKYAVNWGKRNSQNLEPHIKDYAVKAFMTDFSVDQEQAGIMYNNFVEKAKQSQIMINFDPLTKLSNGVTLIEQLISDGQFKNDYFYNISDYDSEYKESIEKDIFGTDYNEAIDKERPVYSCIDLFNTGREGHSILGGVSIVLNKDTVSKKGTSLGISSHNVPYGQSGDWVRSMEDNHQLLFDRWMAKWKTPGKPNKQRKKAFEAVMNGTPYGEDIDVFEGHIHGNIDLSKDISHISAPKSFEKSKKKEATKLRELCKLHNISIKYE